MKNLRIFLLFSRYSFKIMTQHPVGALFFFAGKLMRFGLYFLFVHYLLSNTKILAGYNLQETIIFFLAFNVIDTTAQLLFREVYRFRPLVIHGELDGILLRPYHPFMRILVGGIDFLDLFTIGLYIALLVYFILQLHTISPFGIVSFFLLFVNGLLIATAFHIIVLAMGILTTEVDHAIMIYRDLTRIGAFPIDIYREPFRSFVTFILPIGIMISFPVKALLGTLSAGMYFVCFAFAGILLFFSLNLWNYALKKYQSWGG